MKHKLNSKLPFLTFLLSLSLFIHSPALVMAEEFTITGNGSDSENEVAVTTSSNNDIDQSNQVAINNSINLVLNTGDNDASDNSGGRTEISTGNANVSLLVENSVNNSTNMNNSLCCTDSGVSASIEGNADNTENQINLNTISSESVNIEQTAKIKTIITGYVNTGKNTANDNRGGHTIIKTGKINGVEKIINSPINYSLVNPFAWNIIPSYDLAINDNGRGSINTLSFSNLNLPTNVISNHANINNKSFWNLNTGDNEASDNTGGDAVIETGNIDFYSLVNNFINKSTIDFGCGCEEKKEEPTIKREESKTEVKKPENPLNVENKIPSLDVLKAGGPGILGLSDTSGGNNLSDILLFIGLAMTGGGSKILYDEGKKLIDEGRKIFNKK